MHIPLLCPTTAHTTRKREREEERAVVSYLLCRFLFPPLPPLPLFSLFLCPLASLLVSSRSPALKHTHFDFAIYPMPRMDWGDEKSTVHWYTIGVCVAVVAHIKSTAPHPHDDMATTVHVVPLYKHYNNNNVMGAYYIYGVPNQHYIFMSFTSCMAYVRLF